MIRSFAFWRKYLALVASTRHVAVEDESSSPNKVTYSTQASKYALDLVGCLESPE